MVSHLKAFTNIGCKIAVQEKFVFGRILQGSGELYNKNQEVTQQGSEGYTTRIRRLYIKDQEVIKRIFLILVLLYASVERCFVSRMRDKKNLYIQSTKC